MRAKAEVSRENQTLRARLKRVERRLAKMRRAAPSPSAKPRPASVSADITDRKLAEEATRSLVEVGRLLAEAADLDTVLTRVIEKAAELLQAPDSAVFLVERNREGLLLQIPHGRGVLGGYPRSFSLGHGEGIVGKAIQERRPVWTADILSDPDVSLSEGSRERIVRHGLPRAVLAAPLLRGDAVVGGLAVYRPAGGTYRDDEVQLLAALAAQAAIAIENARLFQQELERRQQVEAVRAVSEEITRELDLTTLLALIQRRAVDLVGGVLGAVWLWDEAAQVLVPRAWQGYGEWMGELRVKLGEGISGTVAQRREGLIVNDYRTWARAYPVALERTEVTAALAEPLIYRNKLLGVISLNNAGMGRVFTEADRGLLALFAAQAAIAVENARLYGEAQAGLAALRAQDAAARALLEVSRALTETLDPDLVLDLIVEKVFAVTDADFCGIAQVTPRGDLRYLRSKGYTRSDPSRIIPRGEGIMGRCLEVGGAIWSRDLLDDPTLSLRPKTRARLQAEGVHGGLAVPITTSDGPFGVLFVGRGQAHDHTPDEVAFAEALSAHAAIAIQNARLYDESQRRAREATALAEVGRDLATSLDPDRVLGLIVQQVQQLMGAPFVGLALLDPEREELAFAKGAGLSPDRMSRLRLKVGEGIAGRAVVQRVPLQSSNILEDPRYVATGFSEVEGFRSLLCVPLLAAGRPLGAIAVFRQDQHEFTPAEVDLLARFADQAALALENARLYADSLRRAREAEGLARVARTLTESLDVSAVAERIVENVLSLLGVRAAGFRLLRPDGSSVAVATGPAGAYAPPGSVLGPGMGISGRVVAEGAPVRGRDILTDPRILLDDEMRHRIATTGLRAFLGVPLRVKGAILGALMVADGTGRAFSKAEVELLQTFGDQAALAMENARLFHQEQRRRRQMEGVRAVAAEILRELDLPVLLQLIHQRAADLMGVSSGAVYLWDDATQTLVPHLLNGLGEWAMGLRPRLGEGLAGLVAKRREGVIVNDYRNWPQALPLILEFTEVTAAIGEPLLYRDRLLGVLIVNNDATGRAFIEADQEILSLFAAQAAIAIENARLYKEVRDGRDALRTLSHRLVEIQEAERRNIARELHDEIGQLLTGLKLTLETMGRATAGGAQAGFDAARGLANELIARVRSLSLDLRPGMLDDLGLLPALLWHFERYTAQTGVGVGFEHAGLGARFPSETETGAYRIVQEALTNVARHAGVREAAVRIWVDAGALHVTVEDRGRGFDPASVGTRSSGLTGMRERAVLLGGSLAVESRPGGGARVTTDLPLDGHVPLAPADA